MMMEKILYTSLTVLPLSFLWVVATDARSCSAVLMLFLNVVAIPLEILVLIWS